MPELVGGRYEITGQLGAGAMGVVWRAFDTVLSREVALKELRAPDTLDRDEAADRFLTEARAAARLSHPSIVTVHDVVAEDHRAFMSMELLEGQTLAEVIAQSRGIGDGAGPVMTHVASALGAAHRAGIVHRDLKPENIFLLPSGRVVVCDFGLARIGGGRGTQVGTVMGTPGYMAPEQLQGHEVGPQADVFAWGAVAYELASGIPPFGDPAREDPVSLSYRVVHEDPPPLQFHQDRALSSIISTALAKAPAHRFPDGDHLHHALTTGQPQGPAPTPGPRPPAGRPPTPRPSGPPRQGPRPTRRTPVGAIVLGGVVLVAAIGLLVFALTSGGDEGPTFTDITTRTTAAPDDTGSTDSTPTSRGGSSTTATTPSVAVPSSLTPVGSDYLSISYPTGWHVQALDERQDGGTSSDFFTTKVQRSPGADADTSYFLRVDVTPNVTASAMEAASPVRAGFQGRADYDEIAFRSISLATAGGTIDAVYWEFTSVLGTVRTHTVDVFFIDPEGNGVAVLTRAPDADFSRWRATFDDVRASIDA